MRKLSILLVIVLVVSGLSCGDDGPAAPDDSKPGVPDTWTLANGPHGAGGPIAVDASGRVYVVTGSTVFRSQDEGSTWAVAGEIPNFMVSDLVATGAGYLVVAVAAKGIIRSTDRGATWAVVDTADVNCIVVMPNGDLCAAGFDIVASTDEGATWTSRRAPRGAAAGSALVPFTVRCMAADSKGTLFASGNDDLFRSFDGGATWDVRPMSGIHTIVVDATDAVYAAGNLSISDVIVSTDEGTTWELRGPPRGSHVVTDLVVSGNDVIASTDSEQILKSDNQFRTWGVIDAFAGESYVQMMAVAPDNAVYAAGQNFVYRSIERGPWPPVGVPSSVVSKVFATSSGRVFAGTSPDLVGGILHERAASGEAWTPLDKWDGFPTCFAQTSGELFVGTTTGLMVSRDGGDTWTQAPFSLPVNAAVALGPSYIAVGTTDTPDPGVYESTDSGQSWELTYRDYGVYDIVVTGDTPPRAFIATPNGVLAGGGYGLDGIEVYDLEIGAGDVVFAGTGHGIYRTTDHGDTYEPLPTPRGQVRSILAHTNGNVYVALALTGPLPSAAVYRSTDGGDSWERHDSGLRNRGTISLCEDPDGGVLAGTFGLGVMKAKR